MAGVVALVALRLVVGWHFFKEGTSHYTDAKWSSEGFLRQAKGPLAPLYQRNLPDFHRWEEVFRGAYPADKASEAFRNAVSDDWDQRHGSFNTHYELSNQQKAQVAAAVAQAKQDVADWLSEHQGELNDHVQEWQRLEKARSAASAEEVPHEQERIAAKQAELRGAAAPWLAQLKQIEADLHKKMDAVLTDQQRSEGRLPEPTDSLARVDRVTTWWILIVGACLLVGLFTRLASAAGALFLLTVVATQPFWIATAQPTYNQWIELAALLVLATTHSGRWAGLDFFIHNFLIRPCCGSKGTSDAPDA